MLALRSVTRDFGPARAVDSLDLACPEGKTTVLLGPSGCGKSTILRLMIGILRPSAGEVRLDGRAMTPETALELRRRMGYVIQEGGLFPHLTARENVTLMARWLGWSAPRLAERLTALTALTRFPADGLDRYPAELSGGQRQRVGLMRALMLDPAVVLLDEPLGSLDPMIRADLQTELREIFRRLGKTVVLVTHDLAEAAYLGDVIVLLREGRVVQTGTLAEMLERPAEPFVTRFVNAQRTHLDLGGGR